MTLSAGALHAVRLRPISPPVLDFSLSPHPCPTFRSGWPHLDLSGTLAPASDLTTPYGYLGPDPLDAPIPSKVDLLDCTAWPHHIVGMPPLSPPWSCSMSPPSRSPPPPRSSGNTDVAGPLAASAAWLPPPPPLLYEINQASPQWFVPPKPEERLGIPLDGNIAPTSILGEGAYGVVYLAHDKISGTPYAAKCLAKFSPDGSPVSRQQLASYRREIRLHHKVSRHPNVVSLIKVVDSLDCIWVILEYFSEGDLFKNTAERGIYSGRDNMIRSVFLQLVDVVAYCHSLKVYHRDLKPENILVADGGHRVLVADFGLACDVDKSDEFGCGSLFYMSPECLNLADYSTWRGGYKCAPNDVWSLGVVLVNLLSRRNPWSKASHQDSTYRSFLKNPKTFLKTILPISDEINEILVDIFTLNPDSRITLRELGERISSCSRLTAPKREDSTASTTTSRNIIPCDKVPQIKSVGQRAIGQNLAPSFGAGNHIFSFGDGLGDALAPIGRHGEAFGRHDKAYVGDDALMPIGRHDEPCDGYNKGSSSYASASSDRWRLTPHVSCVPPAFANVNIQGFPPTSNLGPGDGHPFDPSFVTHLNPWSPVHTSLEQQHFDFSFPTYGAGDGSLLVHPRPQNQHHPRFVLPCDSTGSTPWPADNFGRLPHGQQPSFFSPEYAAGSDAWPCRSQWEQRTTTPHSYGCNTGCCNTPPLSAFEAGLSPITPYPTTPDSDWGHSVFSRPMSFEGSSDISDQSGAMNNNYF